MSKKKDSGSTPAKNTNPENKPSQRQLAIMSELKKKFDGSVTKDELIADLRRLQEENPYTFITRNFYRVNGTYSDATWNSHFGTFAEFKRQAKLELSRGAHDLEKKIAKHASLDLFRGYYKEQILPYHNKYDHYLKNKSGRFKTVAVCSDLHDIELDPFVWGIFLDFCKNAKPDVISLAGDVADLPDFSRFYRDPREFKLKERMDFIKEKIFKPLREACPESQIDLVVGNHEMRIFKVLAEQTPAMRVLLSDVLGLSLADILGLDDYDINLVAKLDLSAWSPTDIKDELRENYRVYYNAFMVHHYMDTSLGISGASGHEHRPLQHTFVNLPMGKCTWTQMGAMKNCRTEYVSGADKWTNSFVLAHIDTVKNVVQQEHVIIPGDHCVLHGKLYERKK